MEEPRSQSMLIETATSRSADAPSDRPADVPADQPPNRLDRPTPSPPPTARPMAAPSADVAVADLSAYTRIDTLAPRRTGPFGVTIVPPPSPPTDTAAPFAVPLSALRPPDLWPAPPPLAKPFDFTICACATNAFDTSGSGTTPGTSTNGGAADASDCGCAPSPTAPEMPPSASLDSSLFAPSNATAPFSAPPTALPPLPVSPFEPLPYRISAPEKTTHTLTVAPPWERTDFAPRAHIAPALPVTIVPSQTRIEYYSLFGFIPSRLLFGDGARFDGRSWRPRLREIARFDRENPEYARAVEDTRHRHAIRFVRIGLDVSELLPRSNCTCFATYDPSKIEVFWIIESSEPGNSAEELQLAILRQFREQILVDIKNRLESELQRLDDLTRISARRGINHWPAGNFNPHLVSCSCEQGNIECAFPLIPHRAPRDENAIRAFPDAFPDIETVLRRIRRELPAQWQVRLGHFWFIVNYRVPISVTLACENSRVTFDIVLEYRDSFRMDTGERYQTRPPTIIQIIPDFEELFRLFRQAEEKANQNDFSGFIDLLKRYDPQWILWILFEVLRLTFEQAKDFLKHLLLAVEVDAEWAEFWASLVLDLIPIIGDIKGIVELIHAKINGEISDEWFIALMILAVILLFFPGVSIGVLKAVIWPLKQLGQLTGRLTINLFREIWKAIFEPIQAAINQIKARELLDQLATLRKKFDDVNIPIPDWVSDIERNLRNLIQRPTIALTSTAIPPGEISKLLGSIAVLPERIKSLFSDIATWLRSKLQSKPNEPVEITGEYLEKLKNVRKQLDSISPSPDSKSDFDRLKAHIDEIISRTLEIKNFKNYSASDFGNPNFRIEWPVKPGPKKVEDLNAYWRFIEDANLSQHCKDDGFKPFLKRSPRENRPDIEMRTLEDGSQERIWSNKHFVNDNETENKLVEDLVNSLERNPNTRGKVTDTEVRVIWNPDIVVSPHTKKPFSSPKEYTDIDIETTKFNIEVKTNGAIDITQARHQMNMHCEKPSLLYVQGVPNRSNLRGLNEINYDFRNMYLEVQEIDYRMALELAEQFGIPPANIIRVAQDGTVDRSSFFSRIGS